MAAKALKALLAALSITLCLVSCVDRGNGDTTGSPKMADDIVPGAPEMTGEGGMSPYSPPGNPTAAEPYITEEGCHVLRLVSDVADTEKGATKIYFELRGNLK